MTLYSPEHLEAIRTDKDWKTELRKQFGKRAGRARRLGLGRGVSQSLLRELYVERMAAQEAWYASMGFGSDD